MERPSDSPESIATSPMESHDGINSQCSSEITARHKTSALTLVGYQRRALRAVDAGRIANPKSYGKLVAVLTGYSGSPIRYTPPNTPPNHALL